MANTREYNKAMRAIDLLSAEDARAYQRVLDMLYAKGEGTKADPNRLDFHAPNAEMVEGIFWEIIDRPGNRKQSQEQKREMALRRVHPAGRCCAGCNCSYV